MQAKPRPASPGMIEMIVAIEKYRRQQDLAEFIALAEISVWLDAPDDQIEPLMDDLAELGRDLPMHLQAQIYREWHEAVH